MPGQDAGGVSSRVNKELRNSDGSPAASTARPISSRCLIIAVKPPQQIRFLKYGRHSFNAVGITLIDLPKFVEGRVRIVHRQNRTGR